MHRVLLSAVLLCALGGTGIANLVVNGDFEQPLETGWTDTIRSIAGSYRFEWSDTFGSGTGYAGKAYKYLAYYASLCQAVSVPGPELSLSFDTRLVIGGGSSTCWPVAAFFIRYLDSNSKELGATCYYNHHASATWLDNDTMNLVEVTSFGWNHYDLNIAQELATNLPGVNATAVKQVMLDLYAYDNGT